MASVSLAALELATPRRPPFTAEACLRIVLISSIEAPHVTRS